MANTATVPQRTKNGMSEVIDALRSVETESERWQLADALAKKIPTGLKGFDEIIDAAKNAGVRGNLKPNTLRQYRDTAVRWPSADRIDNVSFTAHKEAQNAGSLADSKRVLEGILRKNAKAGTAVTVAEVKAAIAAKKGKPTTKGPGQGKKGKGTTTAPVAQAKAAEIISDLVTNDGKLLIAAIPKDAPLAHLDKVIAGLKKVLGHAERLQMQAQNKANAGQKQSGQNVTPIKRAPVAKKAGSAGNIRGL
jgi:hypothetical protein